MLNGHAQPDETDDEDGGRPGRGNQDKEAKDLTFTLPAVGAAGYTGANARFCIPSSGDLFDPAMGARRGE